MNWSEQNHVIARRISIGGIFERVEALIALQWMLTFFIKVTLYFYAFILDFGCTSTSYSPKLHLLQRNF